MSAAPDAQRRRRYDSTPLAWRAGVVAVASALALACFLLYQDYARQQRELRQLVAATGLDRRQPEVAQRILWEPDVEMARLQVARALVYEALDPRSLATLPPAERMTAMALLPERLEQARQLAEETLRRRPASWAAAMLLGASQYVEWALRGDGRLLSQRGAWERPLQVAAAMAPEEEEPRRFLALAYLEIWPGLGPAERQQLLPLVREALADRATFERAAGTWLALAATAAEAEAVIPDTTWAWQAMAARSARQRDWAGYAAAMARVRGAQERELEAALAELERRRAGGDLRGARGAALNLLSAAAPPNRRHVPLAERALELLPPGPVDEGRGRPLRAWLEWALEMALWEQPGLSGAALRRLVGLLDPLPPHQAALALLVAGELAAAEAVERRHEALATEPWAPYCLIKARVLAARGEVAAARRLLDGVQFLWVGSLPELRARESVAAATQDPAALAAARKALAQRAGEAWPATVWRWRGRVATAGFLAGRAAPGLALVFDAAPAHGVAVEVSLDGEEVPCGPALPGEEAVVEARLGPGLHLLSVTSRDARVLPGGFRLLGERDEQGMIR